jgi:squalene cyclase
MESSERYQQLIKTLDLLRRHLLPEELEASKIYPEGTYIRVRAYLVLAHAEIEFFLEERIEEVVQHANKIWKKDSQQASFSSRGIFRQANGRTRTLFKTSQSGPAKRVG